MTKILQQSCIEEQHQTPHRFEFEDAWTHLKMFVRNPAFQDTAKKIGIMTILLIFARVGFAVISTNNCNAIHCRTTTNSDMHSQLNDQLQIINHQNKPKMLAEPFRGNPTPLKFCITLTLCICVLLIIIYPLIIVGKRRDTTCDRLDFPFQCQKQGKSQCCSVEACQGSCYLQEEEQEESNTQIYIFSILFVLLFCAQIVIAFVLKRRQNREREAFVNDIELLQ